MQSPKGATRPHIKIAYMLILFGMSIFMLERYGLNWMSGQSGTGTHLGGLVLSILVAAPMVLIIGGCLVFAVGGFVRRQR